MRCKSIQSYLLIFFMILGVSSCSKDNLDERLIGTWESESAFIVIKKDRTMKIMNKAQESLIQEGPISTEDGGLLFLKKKSILWYDEDEIIRFFDYAIINSENVRIDNSLFTRRGGIRLKEDAVPIGGQRGVKKLEGETTDTQLDRDTTTETLPQDLINIMPDNKANELVIQDGNIYWGNSEYKVEKSPETNKWEVFVPGSGWYEITKDM